MISEQGRCPYPNLLPLADGFAVLGFLVGRSVPTRGRFEMPQSAGFLPVTSAQDQGEPRERRLQGRTHEGTLGRRPFMPPGPSVKSCVSDYRTDTAQGSCTTSCLGRGCLRSRDSTLSWVPENPSVFQPTRLHLCVGSQVTAKTPSSRWSRDAACQTSDRARLLHVPTITQVHTQERKPRRPMRRQVEQSAIGWAPPQQLVP